jgi:hypothetical protein
MDSAAVVYYIILLIGVAGSVLLTPPTGIRRLQNAGRILQEVPRRWAGRQVTLLVEEYRNKRRKERMDREIQEGISFLRNAIAIGRGKVAGSDPMIEELCGHRGLLSPIYGQMLRLLRLNKKTDAISYFAEAVNTNAAKEYGRLLIQWDEIDPRELMETLISHQKNMNEVSLTLRKKRDETISDLIYLPVVVNLMIVFINFIYVAYFLDQKEMLTLLL